jgi:hypothetical protein
LYRSFLALSRAAPLPLIELYAYSTAPQTYNQKLNLRNSDRPHRGAILAVFDIDYFIAKTIVVPDIIPDPFNGPLCGGHFEVMYLIMPWFI